ncbi:hypothetical protein, partial [Escherichia coli]|uniref:hypothetical protein n=1 Tax=Escherichia coli TaxID=562 RepID=UPI001CA433B3
ADRNRSHWSTSKTPSYTKSVSWQHHPFTHIHNEGVTGVFPDIEQIARLQKIVEELGVVTDAATV